MSPVMSLVCHPLALLVLLVAALSWSGGAKQERAAFAFINRGDIINLD